MALDRPFIRRATDHDVLGLLGIKADEILHRERLERQERGLAAYLLAGDAAHPALGFVLLKWHGDTHSHEYPVLEDLLVREEFRGLGLGSRLIAHAENLCRQRSIAQIGLGVNSADNPRAYALYERLGYRETGEPAQFDVYAEIDENGQRRLYENWCVHMVKDLTQGT